MHGNSLIERYNLSRTHGYKGMCVNETAVLAQRHIHHLDIMMMDGCLTSNDKLNAYS